MSNDEQTSMIATPALAAGGILGAITALMSTDSLPLIMGACSLLGVIVAQTVTWLNHRRASTDKRDLTMGERVAHLEQLYASEIEGRKTDNAFHEYQVMQLKLAAIEFLRIFTRYKYCALAGCPQKDDQGIAESIEKIEELLEDPLRNVPGFEAQRKWTADAATRLEADIIAMRTPRSA